MHRSAHTAKPLREQPRITGIAPAQNLLDTAPHGARSPCIADRIVVNLDINAEVSFDSGDGINGDSFRHRCLLLFGICRLFVFAEMPVLEISGPPDVRTPEPEVTRHVMPLAQWCRKNSQALHCNQKTQNAKGNESERDQNFDGCGKVQSLGIWPKCQGSRTEAVYHTARRTENVAHKHWLRIVIPQLTSKQPPTAENQEHL